MKLRKLSEIADTMQDKYKDIKNKKANLARWVHEVILRFRCQLIDEKVAALQSDTAEDIDSHHGELLEEIVQYHKLKTVLSGRLNRVV